MIVLAQRSSLVIMEGCTVVFTCQFLFIESVYCKLCWHLLCSLYLLVTLNMQVLHFGSLAGLGREKTMSIPSFPS